jgi:hypothetical protein
MKYDLKDTTFIIPLRIESGDRMRNVITSLCYLLSNFDTNIIVKEGDASSVFLHHVLPQVKEFLEVADIPNLSHCFEDTSASEFHRTRYLNEMTHMATTKVVVNYDCDIILPVETYIQAQDMIVDGHSDVVYPYGFGNYARMAQVDDETVTEFLTEGFSIDLLESKSAANNARFGFCQFFDRGVYISGGGENEDFIAYAPEDEERAFRFVTLGYKVNRIEEVVYHLEHTRTPNSWFNNPHMQKNFELWNKIKLMDKEQLINYYNLHNG